MAKKDYAAMADGVIKASIATTTLSLLILVTAYHKYRQKTRESAEKGRLCIRLPNYQIKAKKFPGTIYKPRNLLYNAVCCV